MTLDELGLKFGTDKASSHHDYCRIYEEYFRPLQMAPMALLEIGVQFGNSLKMWMAYFQRGDQSFYGVDVGDDFKCEDPRYHFYKGSQDDPAFWRGFPSGEPHRCFNIVLDDGHHRAAGQKIAFACLWPRVNAGGCYCIEDVEVWWHDHPCFTSSVDGKAWLLELAGDLNYHGKSYYCRPGPPHPTPGPTEMEKSIDSIHLFKGLVILKKK